MNIISQSFKNIPKQLNVPCTKEAENLRKIIRNGQIDSIKIVQSDDDISDLEKVAESINSKFRKTVVLGTGGSSLGGKTIASLSDDDKIEFLESIDPDTIKRRLRKIDIKTTFFLVISKSGETIETICQSTLLIDLMQSSSIAPDDRMMFILGAKESSLGKIAKSINAKVLDHPANIGGRYSCFSLVGCLPTLISGLSARKFREGARKSIKSFLEISDLEDNSITKSCASILHFHQAGISNLVIMPYHDLLHNFNIWCRQLISESLGKNGFGITPIDALGTVDQHSQIQIYADGKKDKFFTFIRSKNRNADSSVKSNVISIDSTLAEIFNSECNSTIALLEKRGMPIRIIDINGELDEEVLGFLMMNTILGTILIAKTIGIDPFDQPAVEERKKMVKYIF